MVHSKASFPDNRVDRAKDGLDPVLRSDSSLDQEDRDRVSSEDQTEDSSELNFQV